MNQVLAEALEVEALAMGSGKIGRLPAKQFREPVAS
jgi:hypothetical protein